MTGQGGGAANTVVAPGETPTIEARLLYPGMYMYHCAMGDVPVHITRGMYGGILVDPAEPLPGGRPRVVHRPVRVLHHLDRAGPGRNRPRRHHRRAAHDGGVQRSQGRTDGLPAIAPAMQVGATCSASTSSTLAPTSSPASIPSARTGDVGYPEAALLKDALAWLGDEARAGRWWHRGRADWAGPEHDHPRLLRARVDLRQGGAGHDHHRARKPVMFELIVE